MCTFSMSRTSRWNSQNYWPVPWTRYACSKLGPAPLSSDPTICKLHSLWQLLAETNDRPLLEREKSVLSAVACTLWHVIHKPECLCESNAGKGGFDAAWQAYWLGLAMEELVYSHPCHTLTRTSPLLWAHLPAAWKALLRGVWHLTPWPLQRSTHRLWGTGPETEPRHWGLSVFALTDCLRASASVLGSKLWLWFQWDVFWDYRVPLDSLKADECPGRTRGPVSSELYI